MASTAATTKSERDATAAAVDARNDRSSDANLQQSSELGVAIRNVGRRAVRQRINDDAELCQRQIDLLRLVQLECTQPSGQARERFVACESTRVHAFARWRVNVSARIHRGHQLASTHQQPGGARFPNFLRASKINQVQLACGWDNVEGHSTRFIRSRRLNKRAHIVATSTVVNDSPTLRHPKPVVQVKVSRFFWISVRMNTECDRDESRFMLVDAVARFSEPCRMVS